MAASLDCIEFQRLDLLMNKNEALERLGLVLLGIAIGVIFGALIVNFPITDYDVLIVTLILLACVFMLQESVRISGDKRE